MQAEALGSYANMMFPGTGGRIHPPHHHLHQQQHQQQAHQLVPPHQSQTEHLDIQQQQQQSGHNYNFPMGAMGGGVSSATPSLSGFAGSQAAAATATAGGYVAQPAQQAHHLSQVHQQATQLPHDTQQPPQGMLPSRGHPFTGYDYNYRAGGYM